MEYSSICETGARVYTIVYFLAWEGLFLLCLCTVLAEGICPKENQFLQLSKSDVPFHQVPVRLIYLQAV